MTTKSKYFKDIQNERSKTNTKRQKMTTETHNNQRNAKPLQRDTKNFRDSK